MKPHRRPAFYTLEALGGWQDYLNLLHLPYTFWHLSYVVMAAAMAPDLHLDRLAGTTLAFFLAVGIGAHALDEVNGRPLGTRIPREILAPMAAVALTGALVLGVVAGLTITPWIFPFVAFGGLIAVAYNLGLWGGRFHSDLWFAFAWGAFPVLTSYWINAQRLDTSSVLLAAACLALSLAQRSLSTQVRTIRRQSLTVDGTMQMADGSIVSVDGESLTAAPERALQFMSIGVPALAVALLASRL